jgi:hypothetical protein
VYVVCCYLHLLNLKPMVFHYLSKQLFRPISDPSPQYPLPILRCPHQVILRVVHTVAPSLCRHTSTVLQTVLPSAASIFHPRSPETGHSNVPSRNRHF